MAKLSSRIKSGLDASGSIVPIGTIVAYAPGYFTASGNVGFTVAGPAGNTVAQINSHLPSNWRVCNGAAPNDSESSIFNTSSRYLPDLTGSRFLMGTTTAGAAGGNASNQYTLTATELPNHNHPASLSIANDNAPHSHPLTIAADNAPHGHPSVSSQVYMESGDTSGSVYWKTPATGPTTASTGSVVLDSGPSGALLRNTRFSLAPDILDRLLATGSAAVTNAPHQHTGSSVSSNSAPHSHAGSTVSTGPAGTGTAFSILPQYLTAFYIMRIK